MDTRDRDIRFLKAYTYGATTLIVLMDKLRGALKKDGSLPAGRPELPRRARPIPQKKRPV